MPNLADWALNLPDPLRTSQVLMWTSPDGRRYFAPVGTPTPDPDERMSPMWVEVRLVRDDEEAL